MDSEETMAVDGHGASRKQYLPSSYVIHEFGK